ncbi:hypothetical protein FPOA_04144 [Fusarium poae]|uniref:Uncharacterized protein n=1 Tax=Fusarium poae TaxID=36050 RepID=A0A1B8ATB4_FUSPO|nr:hypothetical protein FPOA_04144 [Fusarium poae]
MEATSLDPFCVIYLAVHFSLLVVLPHYMFTRLHHGPTLHHRNPVTLRKEVKLIRRVTMIMWATVTFVWIDSMVHFGFDPKAQGWLLLLLVLFNGLVFTSFILPYWTGEILEGKPDDGILEACYYET